MPCNINRASYISLLLLQKGSSCEWISIYSNKHFSLSAKKSLLDFIIFSALLKPFLPGHLSIFFIRVQEGSPFLALPHKRTIILVVLQYTHSTGFNTFHEGTEMECRQYLKWWLGTKPGLWAAAPFSLPPIFPSSARSSRGASLYSAFPQSLAAVASVPFSCFSALLYSSFFSRTRRHFCSALLPISNLDDTWDSDYYCRDAGKWGQAFKRNSFYLFKYSFCTAHFLTSTVFPN